MKANKKYLFITFLATFIVLGFIPGIKIKYASPTGATAIYTSADYFIKNLFHLWKFKLIASLGAVLVDYMVKFKAINKPDEEEL